MVGVISNIILMFLVKGILVGIFVCYIIFLRKLLVMFVGYMLFL